MPFQSILKALIESVPGAMGAVFADYEGEAVDQVSRNGDSYHVKFMGAHYGILLEATRRISATTKTGNLGIAVAQSVLVYEGVAARRAVPWHFALVISGIDRTAGRTDGRFYLKHAMSQCIWA